MKFEQIRSVQDFLQFESILDSGIIKMKDSSYISILEVKPINYNLRSDLEKSNILNSYKLLFQNNNFNLQILIQSKPEDLKEHISKVKKLNLYPELVNKYLEYLELLKVDRKSSAKNFLIILKSTNQEELSNNSLKIKEQLIRCGNIVYLPTKEKVKQIIKSFMKENR